MAPAQPGLAADFPSYLEGLTEGDALLPGVGFFFDLPEVLFAVFVTRLCDLRVLVLVSVVAAEPVMSDSLAYGLASGLAVKVPPPAEGALAAGPLPRPDWPLPDTPSGRMADQQQGNIVVNRKARHDYFIDETVEAGMVLTGSEVKSIRAGRCNLVDSFARISRGEAYVSNIHISQYDPAHRDNHEPTPMANR